MAKPSIIILVIALFSGLNSFSQKISNVRVSQEGASVGIMYDLTGKQLQYNITLFYTIDDGNTWQGPLKNVKGDVVAQLPGFDKKATWNAAAEKGQLECMIQFKLIVEPVVQIEQIKQKQEVRPEKNVEQIEPDVDIEMVFVKGGTFLMGSDKGESNEKPAHSVTVSDFYIGKYEVTQKQWEKIMGNNPSLFMNSDSPVDSVSWYNIQTFISRLNKKTGRNFRLPTEAEWEFAAIGGINTTQTSYPGSEQLDEVAWYAENSMGKTHRVGQKKPNELGIYDMSGNVWEFCSDKYGSFSSKAQVNPDGAEIGGNVVIKGGSWISTYIYCRSTSRSNFPYSIRYSFMGFRLACNP
jgi:formylglycine-generating enzyme required for sulfatase activity